MVVGGEPGIGKSRLAEELASRARANGAEIHWGRCWEEGGAPPYWPWVQVLRACVRERGAEQLADELGAGAAEVAELVPDVRRAAARAADARRLVRPPAGPLPPLRRGLGLPDESESLPAPRDRPGRPELGGQGLAAPARVRGTGARRDDGCCSSAPTATSSSRAATRSRQTLGELSRERLFERVLLRGLAHEDVARFVEAACGFDPDMALVEAVHAQTEGNPFFVGEVVRLLREEGALTPEASRTPEHWSARIPDGVREAVGRRLERLSPPCSATLTVASAIGREFGSTSWSCSSTTSTRRRSWRLSTRRWRPTSSRSCRAPQVVPVHARPDPGDARGRALADAAGAAPRPNRGGARGALRHAGRSPRRRARSPLRRGPAPARRRQARSLLARSRGSPRSRHAPRSRRSFHFERALAAKGNAPTDDQAAELLFGLGRAQLATLGHERAGAGGGEPPAAPSSTTSRPVTSAARRRRSHPLPLSLRFGYTERPS